MQQNIFLLLVFDKRERVVGSIFAITSRDLYTEESSDSL